MAIKLTTQIDNKGGATPETVALLELNLQTAALRWSEALAANANLTVKLTIVETLPGGGANGGPAQALMVGSSNGRQVLEGLAAHELRGAPDQAATHELVINIAFKGYLDGQLWLDPTPLDNGADLPVNKTDGLSVLMHELGHGFGFSGPFPTSSTTSPISTFGERIVTTDGISYFVGPNSTKVYGGPVPLTTGNISHVGNNSPNPGADLIPDLMNGVSFSSKRYVISDLDMAFIADMGIGTIRNDYLKAPQFNAVLNGGIGLDTVEFNNSTTASSIKTIVRDISVSTGSATQPPATVVLQNVERVRFTDKILAFDQEGNAGDAYRLYEAAFNRVSDQDGLSYWVRSLDAGLSLNDVSRAFVQSAEFKTVYGANPSNSRLVDTFYQNVLDRPGEASGVAHWVGVLDRGVAVSEVLTGFSESTENQAAVALRIAGGISLSLDYFI